MGGSSMTRGDIINSWSRREVSTPEKKRGTTRGSGTKRSGQVEALPDRRRWYNKKLMRQRTEATRQPAGADERHETEDGDLAELEAMMP
jgi:hypothetical protein